MNIQFKTIFTLSCFLLCSALTQAQIDLEKDKKQILETSKAWLAAAQSNDLEAAWSNWTDDAIILMPDGNHLRGKEAIRKFTSQSRKDPNFSIFWDVDSVWVSKTGQYAYTYGDGKRTFTGKDGNIVTYAHPYLTLWEKQQDGSWKCIIER